MTLVLNAGSSSIKFRVFGASSRDVLHGQMERIGVRGTRLTASDGTEREFGERVAHGDAPDALRPQSVAWACLGVCLATYERWLREEDADLTALLDESFRRTGAVFGGDRG